MSAGAGAGAAELATIALVMSLGSPSAAADLPASDEGQEEEEEEGHAGHAFWDKRNSLLIVSMVGAHTLDAITTQNLMRRGSTELNPFARPFAKRGWAGQAVASYGFGVAAPMLAMWISHKQGWHRAEACWPIVSITGGLVAGTVNLHWVF